MGGPVGSPMLRYCLPAALLRCPQYLIFLLLRPGCPCGAVLGPQVEFLEGCEVEALRSDSGVLFLTFQFRYETVGRSLLAWKFFALVPLRPGCRSQEDSDMPHQRSHQCSSFMFSLFLSLRNFFQPCCEVMVLLHGVLQLALRIVISCMDLLCDG